MMQLRTGRSILAVVLLCGVLVAGANAAVTLNSSDYVLGTSDDGVSGQTLTLTVNPGNDVVILYGFGYRDSSGPTGATIAINSGDPTTMQLIDSGYDSRGAMAFFHALGDVSATTTVTLTAEPGGRGSGDWVSSSAVAVNNADQSFDSLVYDKSVTTGTSVSSLVTTLEGVSAGSFGFDVLGTTTTDISWTPDVSQTIIGQGDLDGAVEFASSYKSLASGANLFSWSMPEGGSTEKGAHIAIAVSEVPEPATMSLLGLGGLVALRRRRR